MPFATLDELRAARTPFIAAEPGPLFLGLPDRWYEPAHFRCLNDHVSTFILKSESKGDLCLECFAPLLMTLPEDRDGPISGVMAGTWPVELHPPKMRKP